MSVIVIKYVSKRTEVVFLSASYLTNFFDIFIAFMEMACPTEVGL